MRILRRLPDHPWPAFLIGGLVIAGILGWITFRMQARLALEPYSDFQAFYLAAEAARIGADPYRAGQEMYIYPPMLAAWMSPLSRLSEKAAAWFWYGLSLGSTMLALALLWVVFHRRLKLPLERGRFVFGLGLVLLAWFAPLRWEFEQGQTDWLMLLGITVALMFLDRSPACVGLGLGFAINIKYLPLALAVYFAARGKWREVAWTAAGSVLWALAPALVYGWERNLVLLSEGVSGLAKLVGIHIEDQAGYVFPLSYDRSITLPSAFARLAQSWNQGLPVVAVFMLASGLVMLGAALILYRSRGLNLLSWRKAPHESLAQQQAIQTLEFCIVLVLMLTFSPQAMLRHYFLAFPLIVAGAALVLSSPDARVRRGAFVSLLLCGLGSVGADLVTPLNLREVWKYYSCTALTTLLSAGMVGYFGLQHIFCGTKPGSAGTSRDGPGSVKCETIARAA